MPDIDQVFQLTPEELATIQANRARDASQPLPDRQIEDPPETEVERAPTEPPPSLIDVAPTLSVNPEAPLPTLSEAVAISERAAEISAQLQEIPPPAPDESRQPVTEPPQLANELVQLWNALGQLGTSHTELATRVAKLERFTGF